MLRQHGHSGIVARQTLSCCRQLQAQQHARRYVSKWLQLEGRTRSILLDEDNPITNKDAYKLHKTYPDEAILNDDNVKIWRANPYLSLIASPIRKCIWSDKPMPRDFMVAIKAAVIKPDPSTVETASPKQVISIFPRALLHPTFDPSQLHERGKKEWRAYVVCRRSAVYDFMAKNAGWKRIDKYAEPNPLLSFQIESQLRRRIVQELQLLCRPKTNDARQNITHEHSSLSIGQDGGAKPDLDASRSTEVYFASLLAGALKEIDGEGIIRQGTLSGLSKDLQQSAGVEGTIDPPSALLDFRDVASSAALYPDKLVSRLIAYEPNNLSGNELKHLPAHRIPIYSIARLFSIEVADHTILPSTDTTKGLPPDTWAKLLSEQPQLYEREERSCQEQKELFETLVQSLMLPSTSSAAAGTRKLEGIVAVPSKNIQVLQLLKALWRWRLWMGEGWSGDGFGILEATGRKTPTL